MSLKQEASAGVQHADSSSRAAPDAPRAWTSARAGQLHFGARLPLVRPCPKIRGRRRRRRQVSGVVETPTGAQARAGRRSGGNVPMRVSRVSLERGRFLQNKMIKKNTNTNRKQTKKTNNARAKMEDHRTKEKSPVSSTLPVSPSLSSSPRAAARALSLFSRSLLNAISCFHFIG